MHYSGSYQFLCYGPARWDRGGRSLKGCFLRCPSWSIADSLLICLDSSWLLSVITSHRLPLERKSKLDQVWLDSHCRRMNKKPEIGRKKWALSIRKMLTSSSPELCFLGFMPDCAISHTYKMMKKYLCLLASGVNTTIPLKIIPRKFLKLFHDLRKKSLASYPWRNVICVQITQGEMMRIL